MKKILLIVASGKASRFGGFPKAFCEIGSKMNVQNTIDLASEVYEHIYLGVNTETYPLYMNKVSSCEMFPIVTGQGDAHSLIKCLKHVWDKEEADQISVCWGDAVFQDQLPFRELIASMDGMNVDIPGIVACAYDENPYAWFDTDGKNIIRSHFRGTEKEPCHKGLHDQSLFGFNFPVIFQYLEQYRRHMGIKEDDKYEGAESAEMKLLDAFGYFYEKKLLPMQYSIITGRKVYSFNTREELSEIRKSLSGCRHKE